ncbi:hypothetical protein NP493_469g00033 [Ridgeia piscesae]|uniref:Cytochrome P450 n=1 Tax=Ridgeia piscesae TaxID=27915 RepID=A0AAD9KYU6_RIDPI|nr:hypothetical protein NP493_469g00033 [Ridgeia piscesae]
MDSTSRYIWAVVGVVGGAVVLKIVSKVLSALRNRAKTVEGFPGPKTHWLLGNLDTLTNDEHGLTLMTSWSRLYRGVYALWFGPAMPVLVAYHPDTTQAILSSNEPKDEGFYCFLRPWIGDGLLVSKGEKWARTRRLLTKAFHFQVLQSYMEVFSQSTNVLLNKWRQLDGDHAAVELYKDTSLLTLESLTKCIFGVNINCQDTDVSHPYATAVLDMLVLMNQRLLFVPHHNDLIYYFSLSGYRFRRACRVAHDFSRKVVRERQLAKQSGVTDDQRKTKYLSMIDILLEARDEDGTGLSNDEIFDEVDTFMFEGHDTTACGLSWLLHNLATHPECQEKCRREAIDVLGSRSTLEWEDLPKLQYISQCLKESLRLHPPVPFVARRAANGVSFADGRRAPNGVGIVVDINSTHRNPDLWPDPEVFDPERFAPDKVEKRPPFSYIPFSAGYRNCIGQQFAQNQMKTAVALILKNFELTHDASRPPVRDPKFVLRSKTGLWVHLKQL